MGGRIGGPRTVVVLCALLGGAGCTDSFELPDWPPDWLPDWVLGLWDSQSGDEREAALDLRSRPENSTAHTETEVLSFKDVLFDEKLSHEQRIQAFAELDAGALRTRVVPINSAPMGQAELRPRQRTQAERPSSSGLQGARRNVAITMYSTSWCGVCKRARRYMKDKGISFVEHDVDQNAGARAAYRRLNPRQSVPTIQIDDEVLVGFAPQNLEAAIDRAAAKRSR